MHATYGWTAAGSLPLFSRHPSHPPSDRHHTSLGSPAEPSRTVVPAPLLHPCSPHHGLVRQCHASTRIAAGITVYGRGWWSLSRPQSFTYSIVIFSVYT